MCVTSRISLQHPQVKYSEEDLLRARRANATLTSQKAALDQEAAALRLENEMIGRQVRTAATEKEKAMVDHDVMKLVSSLGSLTVQFVR